MSGSDDDLAARARSRVGHVLCGKYRIESVLGVGGMATVYAATHRNGHRVAIKVLHAELSVNTSIRTRFRREGHAANGVKHPGAVVVIDDDVAEDGSAFLVMELLAGESVEQLWELNGQRLPVKTVLAIARELCEVLAAAHRDGTVHRDIKPANLFLTREGHVKVLDYGIARVRDAALPTVTESGEVFGTPNFMAPEQAMGRATRVDGQTDLWAVGATMFTLISGAVVHEGETSQHLTFLAATRPARSLRTVCPEADARLVALVDRALAFDKTDRWPTAQAMGDAISSLSLALFGTARIALASVSDTLVAARPARVEPRRSDSASSAQTVPQIVRRDSRRRTRAIRAIAAAVVLVVPLTVAFVLRGGRPVLPRDQGFVDAATTAVMVPPPARADSPVALTPDSSDSSSAPRAVGAAPTRDTAVARSKPAPRPPPRAPAAGTSAAPSASAAANCAEPFVITADGKKLWRAECL
jgi:serine/threonine-protein kinase